MPRSALTICLLIVGFICGCAQRPVRQVFEAPHLDTVDPNAYLKAHMPDGSVYIFSTWSVDPQTKRVAGEGKYLDFNRKVIDTGLISVAIDDVAIFESNDVQASPTVGALTVITIASLGVTVACAANPKACFGSCPTFYVWDGQRYVLEGEGFSGSVTPSLEEGDVDALPRARPQGGIQEVVMRNEALETHVVRSADLIAVSREHGQRVFHSLSWDSERGYWQTGEPVAVTRATGEEGDCTAQLARFDGLERTSLADSTNLATREAIELVFDDVPGGDLGLVLAYRQTLLTTFLFYQTLAYMGTSAGTWFAMLESGGDAMVDRVRNGASALGGIRVLVMETDGVWTPVEEFYETGPLATNQVVVPLHKRGPVRVRLEMTKGAWRLDAAAVVGLTKRVEPTRLPPAGVLRDGAPDEDALDRLLDINRTLVTLPGDEYTLVYDLPDAAIEYELFIESRGYYLEWIRESWLKEENHAAAAMLLFDSQSAMIELAPRFKELEPQMEATFWSSRYATP